MAMFVGLDVSLKTTAICIVEADGSPVWEGKAESEPAHLIKALSRWRDAITLVGIEARCPNGFMARSLSAASKRSASRRGTRNVFYRRGRTRPTAAMRAASPT